MFTTSSPTRSEAPIPFDEGLPARPPAVLRPGFGTMPQADAARRRSVVPTTAEPTIDDVAGIGHDLVSISPSDISRRRSPTTRGMTAEIVQTARAGRTEYRFRGPVHLLAVYEEASRHDGESSVEGLPRSTLRNMTRKMTFVPAGHAYYERHEPRTQARLTYFYLDPTKLDIRAELGVDEISFTPRLFFEDEALWESSLKLRQAIENPAPESRLYFEAIGTVLMHELARVELGSRAGRLQNKGGLGIRQQRIVTSYIEEHLPEQIPLAVLADLAHLSPHHFCRAFKQSLGMPPHRYHMSRRIERAKALLADRSASVTEIALSLGFSETSSLSAAFRKSTGLTPRGYRRSLG
jgi:AraC family transcriptional regulator